MKYDTVIGLEVHAQLSSKTKIFCACKTDFGAPPNSQVCPVCLGLPGALPVFNEKVLELGLKAALALNCRIAENMRFDRKNYFYPDLPKAYQISQLDRPLARAGFIEIETRGKEKKIGITRVHLEEDAGKLIHTREESLVDFNRCGMPLIEIVSEPEINSPREAYEFLAKLKRILIYLEVSDCNMQEGSLRCDANISLRPQGTAELGRKTEIKNLNSFKAVKDALAYEAARQEEALNKGEAVIQETRLWEEALKKTVSMRSKEDAHDYRYFPEPDLPEVAIAAKMVGEIRKSLPELAAEKKTRFIKEYSLSAYDADILTSSKAMADYYEACLGLLREPKEIANWLIGPVLAALNSLHKGFEAINLLQPGEFIEMLKLVKDNKINAQTAKEKVLPAIIEGGKKTAEVLMREDILQVSDESELAALADQAIGQNQKSAADYRAGKESAIMHLVGQVMRLSNGKANPVKVKELLEKKLKI